MLPPTVISLVEQQRDAMQKDTDRIRSIDMGTRNGPQPKEA